MSEQKGTKDANRMARLWEKARALGLNSIQGMTLDDDEPQSDDVAVETVLEVEGDHVVTGGDQWIPPDPTAVINKDKPSENHPKHGYKDKDKEYHWCTDMHRKKTGMEEWVPISRKEHPELAPVGHPMTAEKTGEDDKIWMNDSFLCEASKAEVQRRDNYYRDIEERRLNRKLYESHKQAQREGGGPGIIFKTGKVAHGEVGSRTIERRRPTVSVPAQIK